MRLKPATSPRSVPVRPKPFTARFHSTLGRTLIFDIENRPLSYWFDGRSTADITVIAWKWAGDHQTNVAMQTPTVTVQEVLAKFRPVIDQADTVVGHNVRDHDLKILNTHYVTYNQPALNPVNTIDTLRDMLKWKDVPRSLEYLADWLGCPFPKFHMSQHSWRTANALRDEPALELARKRCAVDVQASEWVWRELDRRNLLTKKPRRWSP